MGRLILAVIFLFPSVIWDYFAWMIRYSKHPSKTPLLKRYNKCRKLIRVAIKRLRIKSVIIGKENIVDGSACYIGNHLSALDCLPIIDAFDNIPISFIAKIEISAMPFVAKVFKASDGIFLDRNDLKQGLRVMMTVQDKLSKGETSYFIFPEGTRANDQMALLLPFHNGTFRAAMKARVPIVPVVSFGSFTCLSTKHHWKQYPTITKFLKPIMPDEYENKSTEEIANLVSSLIQKELAFNVREQYHKILFDSKNKGYSPYKIY